MRSIDQFQASQWSSPPPPPATFEGASTVLRDFDFGIVLEAHSPPQNGAKPAIILWQAGYSLRCKSCDFQLSYGSALRPLRIAQK